MKHTLLGIILTLAMMISSLNANARIKEFKTLKEVEGIEYVHIPKLLLKVFTVSFRSDCSELGDLPHRTNSLRMYCTETASASAEVKKILHTIIDKENFNLLIDANSEDNETMTIYIKGEKKKSTLMILSEEGNELDVLVVTGKFSTGDLNNLSTKTLATHQYVNALCGIKN